MSPYSVGRDNFKLVPKESSEVGRNGARVQRSS